MVRTEENWKFYRDTILGIPTRFKDADFKKSRQDKSVTAQLKKEPTLLHGDVGDGKTWQMYALCKYLVFKNIEDIEIVNWTKQIDSLHTAAILDRVAYTERLKRLQTCKVLIIDDFGVESDSEFNLRILYMVFDSRYNENLTTYMTTNLTDEEYLDKVGSRNYRRTCELMKGLVL